MKALRFYAPGDVRLEDVPEPECGPREVKIKVKNCSTCGTDVKIRNNGHVNITRVTHHGPRDRRRGRRGRRRRAGHGFQVGDRVQCIAAVPCGDCYECGKGWMEVCQNQTSVGIPVRRRLRGVHDRARAGAQGRRAQPDPGQRRLRRSVSRRAVRLRDQRPGATRHRGGRLRRRLRRRPDRLHAHPHRPRRPQGAARSGSSTSTPSASRCRPTRSTPTARHQRAEVDVVARVMELTGGRGADVIITATPANITQEQAISMAARNGRISFFGGLPKNDPFIQCDSNLVHYRQLHIHGANGSSPRAQQEGPGVHLDRPGAGQGPHHRARRRSPTC
jgi:L-iditol 2-dehydrogenase